MTVPRQSGQGELSTNVAMVAAPLLGRAPKELAATLAAALAKFEEIETVEVAAPAFINVKLTAGFWKQRALATVALGDAFDELPLGQGRCVNVEYVSANPTGPLHVAHARGAVLGDVLAALLEKTGHKVVREYYCNDAGSQVDHLARSVYFRYCELLERKPEAPPPGFYPGSYLIPVAQAILASKGAVYLDKPESTWLSFFRQESVQAMMDLVREDLAALEIRHDVFSSEAALTPRVDPILAQLSARGLVYEGVLDPPRGGGSSGAPGPSGTSGTVSEMPPPSREPQLLFRSSAFGDVMDRPLRKADGSWSYFAPDIAYHADKIERGASWLIDVVGADHGGYAARLNAAVRALSSSVRLDVLQYQTIRLLRDGEVLKMSKRGGTYVTVRELVEKVGKDVVRFYFMTRKPEAPMDFDLATVVQQSRENPVYYVQYAYARCHSIFDQAQRHFGPAVTESLPEVSLVALDDPLALGLLRKLAAWPAVLEQASLRCMGHLPAFYMHELASQFHELWQYGTQHPASRFLQTESLSRTRDRLFLVLWLRMVLASGLRLLGVTETERL